MAGVEYMLLLLGIIPVHKSKGALYCAILRKLKGSSTINCDSFRRFQACGRLARNSSSSRASFIRLGSRELLLYT